ncbi:hypothetical protein J7643_14645 [bacterium]|nr:hypothetical protein [bacterium]
MRHVRPALLAMTLALTACQTEIYPEAPTVVSRPQVAPSAAPEEGASNQIVATNGRYLEFAVGANDVKRLLYAFYPLDAAQNGMGHDVPMSGTLRISDANGRAETLPLRLVRPKDKADPYLFAYPSSPPVVGQSYLLHVEITAGGNPYVGDFTYNHRAK